MSHINIMSDPGTEPTGWKRWWIYQRERFPLLTHGIAIGLFSFAAVEYGWMVSEQPGNPGLLALGLSFATTFVFFALMRIADEFKDFADDARYRPYRPVPRGLVQLAELGGLGVLLAGLQFALALIWMVDLGPVLIATWIYFLLMCREFFVPRWLKARPVIYLVSHMAIMPLIALCASAPGWLGNPAAMAELGPFLGLALSVGLVGEIGRKIRAPADEEEGVETYSVLWGIPVAVSAWLAAIAATAITAGLAALVFGAGMGYFAVLAIALLLSLLLAAFFTRRPRTTTARLIEAVSGLWALLGFGALALFARFPLAGWS